MRSGGRRGRPRAGDPEPTGVVAAVVPWNFPLTLAGWKLGPPGGRLHRWCSPSELSPLSALHRRLAREAGMPPASSTSSTARGPRPAVPSACTPPSTSWPSRDRRWSDATSCATRRTRTSSWSGSSSAAVAEHRVRRRAGPGRRRRRCCVGHLLQLRPDVHGRLAAAGRETIADDFTERVLDRAAIGVTSDPLDPASAARSSRERGPPRARPRSRLARQEAGARLRTGGGRTLLESGGSYVEPTVLRPRRRGQRPGPRGLRSRAGRAPLPRRRRRRPAGSRHQLAASPPPCGRRTCGRHRVSRSVPAGTVWVNCYGRATHGALRRHAGQRQRTGQVPPRAGSTPKLKTTWISLG